MAKPKPERREIGRLESPAGEPEWECPFCGCSLGLPERTVCDCGAEAHLSAGKTAYAIKTVAE